MGTNCLCHSNWKGELFHHSQSCTCQNFPDCWVKICFCHLMECCEHDPLNPTKPILWRLSDHLHLQCLDICQSMRSPSKVSPGLTVCCYTWKVLLQVFPDGYPQSWSLKGSSILGKCSQHWFCCISWNFAKKVSLGRKFSQYASWPLSSPLLSSSRNCIGTKRNICRYSQIEVSYLDINLDVSKGWRTPWTLFDQRFKTGIKPPN